MDSVKYAFIETLRLFLTVSHGAAIVPPLCISHTEPFSKSGLKTQNLQRSQGAKFCGHWKRRASCWY
jgi:hypothetical protein